MTKVLFKWSQVVMYQKNLRTSITLQNISECLCIGSYLLLVTPILSLQEKMVPEVLYGNEYSKFVSHH
jgi:hypothetical protein